MQVKSQGQPLLMSRAKKRGLDGNANPDLLLIPEMCFMTGLTERMRADTRVRSLSPLPSPSPGRGMDDGGGRR